MIEHHRFDGFSFVDVGGVQRFIYGCSLKNRRELSVCFGVIMQRVEAGLHKTLQALYDHDREFQAAANKALELCGIEQDWVSVQMMGQLLLPYKTDDGTPKNGLLHQVNFPAPAADQPEPKKSYEEAIAALWTHTRDYDQAMRAAGYANGEHPAWGEVQDILDAHNRMTDPKAKEKAETAKAAADMERMLKDGTFFNGLTSAMQAPAATGKGPRIASPRESDATLEEFLSQ